MLKINAGIPTLQYHRLVTICLTNFLFFYFYIFYVTFVHRCDNGVYYFLIIKIIGRQMVRL